MHVKSAHVSFQQKEVCTIILQPYTKTTGMCVGVVKYTDIILVWQITSMKRTINFHQHPACHLNNGWSVNYLNEFYTPLQGFPILFLSKWESWDHLLMESKRPAGQIRGSKWTVSGDNKSSYNKLFAALFVLMLGYLFLITRRSRLPVYQTQSHFCQFSLADIFNSLPSL